MTDLPVPGTTPRVLSPLDVRIPPWDFDSLIERTCPFCASRGTPRFLRPDKLVVNFCDVCGAFYISPSPDKPQLDAFYARYHAVHRTGELRLYQNDRSLLKEMFALDPLSDVKVKRLATLTNLDSARTLDVGFGLGQTMVLLKKLGAIVSGIDLDHDAVEFARNMLGIDAVRQCDLSKLNNGPIYHLITLHDMVEHPLDPMSVLTRAMELLAPGGLLSVWTPNASGALEEPAPVLFRVDLEHMQYLSFTTCSHVARSLGLQIVHLESTGHPRLHRLGLITGKSDWKSHLKNAVRYTPGFRILNMIRRNVADRVAKQGGYHLFCVFKRNG